MELRIGPPATGLNFFQRPTLIAKLLQALKRGHVAFLGPRRTGKTSCLEEIKAHPEDFLPVLINLERHDTPEAWLASMLTGLRTALDQPQPHLSKFQVMLGRLQDRISKIDLPVLGSVELARPEKTSAWRKPADEFLALLVETDAPVLFLLDEFPTFLKLVAAKSNREDVESLLNWFRAARHDLKDRQARFLVTGSIGLKGVVRKLGLAPAVNDFDTHDIPPLTEAEAHSLLETLAQDQLVPLTATGRETILLLLGGNWPFLLQLFIAELQDAAFAKAPTAGELEAVYRGKLVHGVRNTYCDNMFDRLPEVFPSAECQLAREILKATCRTETGLGREDFDSIHARLIPNDDLRAGLEDSLNHVLDTLKHDGYLHQHTTGAQHTAFASRILRDFWRRKTS